MRNDSSDGWSRGGAGAGRPYYTGDGAGGFLTARSNQIVRVVGRGRWTIDILDAHFIALDAMLDGIRRSEGRALVLVDVQEAGVQLDGVVEHVIAWGMRIYHPGDRLAVALASHMFRTPLHRPGFDGKRLITPSAEVALRWLLADEPPATV